MGQGPPPEALGERRYTLMIVPERGRGHVAQLSITLAQLRRWLVVLSVCLVLAAVGLASALTSWPGSGTRHALLEENLALRGRLQEIEAKLDETDRLLERLRSYEAELQDVPEAPILGTGPLDRDEAALLAALRAASRGWGEAETGQAVLGPALDEHGGLVEGADSETEAWAAVLQTRIEVLSARARLAEQRLGEVVASVDDIRLRREAMPTRLPIEGAVLTSPFGYRRSPFTRRWKFHSGLDLSAPRGTPVHAAAAGTVIQAGWMGGYGRMVQIDHGNGMVSRYGHNSRLFVHEGDHVQAGQLISTVGTTGQSTGPHLHFEIFVDGHPVDPLDLLE